MAAALRGLAMAAAFPLLCSRGTADPAAAGGLSLERCLDTALAKSPLLARHRAEAGASEAAASMAKGHLWPEVHAVGGYSHFIEDRLISPRRPGELGALGFTDDLLQASVVVKLPLYMGGRLRRDVDAAEFLSQAAEQRLLHTREELVFNVSSVFYGMLGQREVIRALGLSREALEQHHRKTLEFVALKKAARVDALRTEVRLAEIGQQILREENALAVQGYLLASLMGWDPEAASPEIAGDLLLPAVPDSLDEGLAEILGRRQDYQAMVSAVQAQRARAKGAEAGRRPQVSLRASYGNQWALDRSDANEVGEVGIFVDVPLFEGGRIDAAIRRERERLRAAEEAERELRLRIRLEVATAAASIRSILARIQVTEKAMAQADESLRIERERYDLGKGTLIDTLDAQSASLASQTNHYRALADYHVALAQLRLATGLRP